MARDFPAGAGDFLSVGDVAAIDITGTALTLAAFINPDSVSGFRQHAGKEGATGTTVQYALRQNGSTLEALVGDAGGIDTASGGTISTGAWQHVAMVKNGTGAGALLAFLSGAQVGSATSNRSIQNTAFGFRIGNRDGTANVPFDGRIAEVAVWDAALTAAEVAALAKGFSPALIRPQSLCGYWCLFGNASPEPDLCNANNATINGTVTKADHPRILVPRPALYLP